MKVLISVLLLCFFFILPESDYKLVETDNYASCANYKLVNNEGIQLAVAQNIFEAMQCPSLLDLNTNNQLTFREGNAIKLFDISTQQQHLLFNVYDDIDGIGNPVWSEDNSKVMFVMINQERKHGYAEFARLIVLGLDNRTVISKQKFDRPVHFVCGSNCSSEANVDFGFTDNDKIWFKRNENIDDEPGKIMHISLKE